MNTYSHRQTVRQTGEPQTVKAPILGEQVSAGRRSMTVPSDRMLVSSCRVSIVTMQLTEAVWLQVTMQVSGAVIFNRGSTEPKASTKGSAAGQ